MFAEAFGTSSASAEKSRAADPNPQRHYRSCAKDEFSDHGHLPSPQVSRSSLPYFTQQARHQACSLQPGVCKLGQAARESKGGSAAREGVMSVAGLPQPRDRWRTRGDLVRHGNRIEGSAQAGEINHAVAIITSLSRACRCPRSGRLFALEGLATPDLDLIKQAKQVA